MHSSTCLNPKSQPELYRYSVSKTETGGGGGLVKGTGKARLIVSHRGTEKEVQLAL